MANIVKNVPKAMTLEWALLETGSAARASDICGVNANTIRQHVMHLRRAQGLTEATFPELQIQQAKRLALKEGLTDIEIAAMLDGWDADAVNDCLDRWQGLQKKADERREKLAVALAPSVPKPLVVTTLAELLKAHGVGLDSIPGPLLDEVDDVTRAAVEGRDRCADR